MQAIGKAAVDDTRIYFTGGATAVLYGWRDSTLDIDIAVVPDRDDVLRAIPSIKENLQVNVELASPEQFVPVKDGWDARSPFIEQVGRTSFYHFDLYAQVLAKIERGHVQDLADVAETIERGLVKPDRLLEYFNAVEPYLYRYPAVAPDKFGEAVREVVGKWAKRRPDDSAEGRGAR